MTPADARRLLLDAQGLTADPARPATPAAVRALIRQLGFVQLDSIQRLERAHHLILGARFDGYRPETLSALAFQQRVLFEHWTHDASLIPIEQYPMWKPRFVRWEARLKKSKWFSARLGKGKKAAAVLGKVLARVERHGHTRARDFDRGDHGRATGWWDWTPEKAALEFLWHTGAIAVTHRDGFEKVYDLAHRVHPGPHAEPSAEAHVDWAARSALERLGVATPTELAKFWDAITIAEANHWAKTTPGLVRTPLGVAFADWEDRLRKTREAPDVVRVLAPFDPIVRDRKRLQRLFGFDYRFEAFVPAAKRRWGYYVLPILEGDRLIGRVDARYDKELREAVIDGLWWERGVKGTPARKRAVQEALARIAARRQPGDASSA